MFLIPVSASLLWVSEALEAPDSSALTMRLPRLPRFSVTFHCY